MTTRFGQLERAYAQCPVGSALLFNGKMNHRGTGNASQADRPCIYTVYHKQWYALLAGASTPHTTRSGTHSMYNHGVLSLSLRQ